MKKVIFELIDINTQKNGKWVCTKNPKNKFFDIMSALEWAYEEYHNRIFEVDVEKGTISIKNKHQKNGDI